MTAEANEAARYEFRAEIRQVLDILVHSLYTEREIFLRELISNASDALNRFKFESLTAGNVHDAGAELGIWISLDKETKTLTIRDSGLGMTQEEMIENLGTIAQSGAKNFLKAVQGADTKQVGTDVIGQFGVGFYSVFMVAEEVRVSSRSFRPDAEAAFWASDGQGSYSVGPAQKEARGTTLEIKLKEDALEFLEPYRLRQVIKTHSDFIAFPIYLEDEGAFKQVNQQTALWRQAPKEVEEAQYTAFYGQLTFDSEPPLASLHISADVPIQFYALLFIPSGRDYRLFHDDYGLKLYARKVLIEERSKDLLPPYLRFLEGVVDSEDIPLNVSREAVQATPTIGKIRNALTGRVLAELKRIADKDSERYHRFYKSFGQAIKEGVATDPASRDKLLGLLRFPSSQSSSEDELVSLADYAARMPESQQEIYYLLADDYRVASRSAHLEPFKERGLEVLLFTDPVDAFMLMGLTRYEDKPLKAIDEAGLELPQEKESAAETEQVTDLLPLLERAREVLGARVEDVRESRLLTGSPCRLVNPSGAASNLQRMQRLMGQEGDVPKKILELNPQSELIQSLAARLQQEPQDALVGELLEQLYENELLMEGLHPNPAEMIPRLQRLMAKAAKTP